MPSDSTNLIKQLMEKCDHLYRENSRLREIASEKLEPLSVKDAYDKQLSQKDAIIAKKDLRISNLEKQVCELQRQLYGKKSERFIKPDALDRWLDFEGFDMLPGEEEAAQEAETEIKAVKAAITARRVANKKQPVRKPLPAEFPREEIHIYPQGYNEGEWTLLPGEEVTELLMHEPGKFYVKRIIRHTAKRKDTKEIKTGVMPVLPIAKSYASSCLLADLTVGKYVDHLPLNRQIEMFKRVGVYLPPPTVNGWIREVADLLRPLHFRLQELVMEADYLQSDETTIPVIRDGKHKAVKGYIWLVRSVMDGRQFFYYDYGSDSQEPAGFIRQERVNAYNTIPGFIPVTQVPFDNPVR
ncbi:hypothetical protein JCM30204_49650 [Dysgonomonas termitidis]